MIQAMLDKYQKKYLKRAKIISGLLILTPFVRAVFLTGSVARGEATEKSDIDFFVIIKKDRLYTGRFFVTGLVYLTGLRRYDKKIAGRICLNCYQTEDHLLVSPQTEYVANDYSKAIVLWARGNLDQKFIDANSWMRKFGINIKTQKKYLPRRQTGQKTSFFFYPLFLCQFIFESIFELIFHDFGEKILKKYQIKKIRNNSLTKIATKGEIYISDTELRFHPKTSLDI